MLIIDVKSKVKDDSGKLDDPGDYEAAVTEALNRYSKARPLEFATDILGGGSHDLELPSDFLDGFSGIVAVEYPVDYVPEQLIDRRDYRLYRGAAGLTLRLLADAPTATETVRVTYTIPHSEESVPVTDLEAVGNLAASFCLRKLAASYGQTVDPTISADVVNYRSKTDEFRRLADSYESLYKEHLGIKEDETTPAAMATASRPDSASTRLTHRRG